MIITFLIELILYLFYIFAEKDMEATFLNEKFWIKRNNLQREIASRIRNIYTKHLIYVIWFIYFYVLYFIYNLYTYLLSIFMYIWQFYLHIPVVIDLIALCEFIFILLIVPCYITRTCSSQRFSYNAYLHKKIWIYINL